MVGYESKSEVVSHFEVCLFRLLYLTRFQVLYVATCGFFLSQNDSLLIQKV